MAKIIINSEEYYNLKKNYNELKERYTTLKNCINLSKTINDSSDNNYNDIKNFYIKLVENKIDLKEIDKLLISIIDGKDVCKESEIEPPNEKQEVKYSLEYYEALKRSNEQLKKDLILKKEELENIKIEKNNLTQQLKNYEKENNSIKNKNEQLNKMLEEFENRPKTNIEKRNNKDTKVVNINNGSKSTFNKQVIELQDKKEKYNKLENKNNKIIELLNNAEFKKICVDEYINDKQVFKEKIIEHRNIFEKDYKNFIEYLYKIKSISKIGNKLYNGEKAIISLTSWKERINTVSKTLYNLLVQCPGFHIVLVLSEEEFPQKEKELPINLRLFIDNNLIEILWVYKNYKAFKKILFTMNKYRDVPIISADDDCIYLYNYAEEFYNAWLNNKNTFISCWFRNIDGAIHTAGAGTLYPPYIFKNLGLKCLCSDILKYTNQDDDYYTELRRELKLTDVKIIKRWNLTYYFHDEINPLHDEIKLTTKKDLHKFLKEIIDKYKKDIIISITSYPKRINNIQIVIKLLLDKQTLCPDKIYLWLSEEEFSNKEKDLPQELLNLINNNSSIYLKWVKKNTYVHKRHEIFKYVNNGYIFLIDDDVEYNSNLIESVVNISKEYPNTIILYNRYSPHIYNGIKIKYKRNDDCILGGPYVNTFRWCGQSMIPADIYPKEILSDEYQNIRNNTSPVSDECWFQPWVVYNDIPLYSCDFGWGKDISEETGKKSGLVSWSHQKDKNGYEKRDIWLNNVLKAFPKIYQKYKQLFNYDEI